MTRYIVTVKLPKNPTHDPKNKVAGPCRVWSAPSGTCTNVTGRYHSFLLEVQDGRTVEDIRAGLSEGYRHITRIEEVI